MAKNIPKNEQGPITRSHRPNTELVRLVNDDVIAQVSDIWGLPSDPEAEDDGSIISLLKRLRRSDFVLFNLLPTWGVTAIRNRTELTGSGSAALDGGEILVESGTTTGSRALLQTRERGQYRSGSEAEAGLGIRVPTQPTGDGVIRFGYFDDDNGFGYLYDANGIAIFRRKAGTDTIIRQADWNNDTLDGSGDDNNPTGIDLSLANGNIHQIRFWWYGYGTVRWITEVPTVSGNRRTRVLLHRQVYTGEVSIDDPNQPIAVEVDNGTTTDNLECYVGGRQYGIRARTLRQDRRSPEAVISEYLIPTADEEWHPLLVARGKAEFPPGSGRVNSVRSVLRGAKVSVNARIETRLTGLDTVTADSTAGWVDPEGVPSDEAAIEVQVQDGNLAVLDDGSNYQFSQDSVSGNVNDVGSLSTEEEFVIGDNDIVTLWVRKMTANNTTVQFAALDLDEQW